MTWRGTFSRPYVAENYYAAGCAKDGTTSVEQISERQRLTLVHFPAQLEPCLKTPCTL
jgi:hypothetical protein